MSITSPTTRQRIAAGVMAALAATGAVVVAAAPAQSQSSACSGTATVPFGPGSFGDGSSTIFSSPNETLGWETSRTYSVSMPAGRYDLTGRSYDGYEGRQFSDPLQLGERWKVEFLSASGTVLATSATTPDLADGVEEASWSGGLGSVTLAQAATQVRVVHGSLGGEITNSVSPVCIGAVLIPAPTTTTAPAPTPTVPSGPGLTLPPAAPPQVAGQQVVPPAAPAVAQTAQPRFTG